MGVLNVVNCTLYSRLILLFYDFLVIVQSISFVDIADQCIFCTCQDSIESCLFELCV